MFRSGLAADSLIAEDLKTSTPEVPKLKKKGRNLCLRYFTQL